MRRSVLPALAPALAVVATLVWAGKARAGISLRAELDGAQGIDMPGGTRPGYGFAAALGYRIGLGPIFIQPEAQGGYLLFPTDAGGRIHVTRILGGAHFGLSGKIQPAIHAHAGVGWLSATTSGPALGAGLSLAFKLIPVLSFGAQADYNVVTVSGTGPATKWVGYGAHVAVDF